MKTNYSPSVVRNTTKALGTAAIFMLLGACSNTTLPLVKDVKTTSPLESPKVLIDSHLDEKRRWILKELPAFGNLAALEEGRVPHLTISEKGINGYTGCNRFFGQAKTLIEAGQYQDSKLNIANVAMTRMLCQAKNIRELESDILAMLKGTNHFSVQWPYLNLYENNHIVAKFVATDWK